MTETEILLQLWADTLADVQADKAFMQQVERDVQDADFRTRSNAVRAEVTRRLQKAGALALQPEVPRLEPPRVDRAQPSGNDFLADAVNRPRRHKRKDGV